MTSVPATNNAPVTALPTDMQRQIVRCGAPRDAAAVSMTCRALNDAAAHDNPMWSAWYDSRFAGTQDYVSPAQRRAAYTVKNGVRTQPKDLARKLYAEQAEQFREAALYSLERARETPGSYARTLLSDAIEYSVDFPKLHAECKSLRDELANG